MQILICCWNFVGDPRILNSLLRLETI